MLEFSDNLVGAGLVIGVKGRLDNNTSALFDAHCTKQLESHSIVKNVVLDFEDVNYLSSAGLRSILLLAKKLKERGGKLVFSGAGSNLTEILEIAGFFDMFQFYPSLEVAIKEIV